MNNISQAEQADIKSHRLSDQQIEDNFTDLHPPLSASEASIEADRCYFCYDAPCTTACPTGIDIPGFIQAIRSDNLKGAAFKIFEENILGGMCARVCPTEVLCQQDCVRNTHEDKPVEIGLLQRYATDAVLADNVQFFKAAAKTGKSVAIVGAGPAGLSCAHRLASQGYEVSIFEARDKPAGLNEYGIAAYKSTDEFAQREVDYVLAIGGITIQTEMALGEDITLNWLREEYDAVFLACGLAAVNKLGLTDENAEGVIDAVQYISDLRQASNKADLPVAKNVVVIGGGMTAIDIAIQTKLLGAEQVTIAYRRGKAQMAASEYEQKLAQTKGVQIRYNASPRNLIRNNGHVSGIEFDLMSQQADNILYASGDSFTLPADVVFKAIGQKLVSQNLTDTQAVKLDKGRIIVDEFRRTSVDGVWAGGDCVLDGQNLTVSAVQDGKLAANSINQFLTAKG